LPDSAVCRHFGTCGGCSLQGLSDDTYAEKKREQVVRALVRYGVKAQVSNPIRVPPHSRRRAVFKAKKSEGKVALGFHATQSHTIVDMLECLVLTPRLFEAAAGLKQMLGGILEERAAADLHVTDTDTGLDVALRWPRKTTPTLIATLSAWATKLGVARITSNDEVVFSVAAPMVRLAGVEVELPPKSFLQPTKKGEDALQEIVRDALTGAKLVADLFSGCGTFALALARSARVHAYDDDSAMLSALEGAARRASGLKPVIAKPRDLFRHPVTARELRRFDGVVLDPPWAGAGAQARELAKAHVEMVAYVSCNADSFARDACILRDGGLGLLAVTPIDQFLWSDHIELVGVFERGRN
jgi:23S rRNA (uracil1939-C5)-methyltransferase